MDKDRQLDVVNGDKKRVIKVRKVKKKVIQEQPKVQPISPNKSAIKIKKKEKNQKRSEEKRDIEIEGARIYPFSTRKRTVFRGLFWSIFILIFILALIAMLRVINLSNKVVSSPKQEVIKQETSPFIGSPAVETFAYNFAKEYFRWDTKEKSDGRKGRLEPYLVPSMDEQAGITVQNGMLNSTFIDAKTWEVKQTSAYTANVVLEVEYSLTKVIQSNGNKGTPVNQKEEKTGPFKEYLVVPVQTDKDQQSFAVYKTPYFTAIPKKPTITEKKEEIGNRLIEPVITNEIQSFLNVFFKAYTGEQAELNYYIKGINLAALNGVVTFKELSNMTVYATEKENEYKVDASVVMIHKNSQIEMTNRILMTVEKDKTHYLVKKMENQ
ncbi:MAG: conjugal transfer protein [Bacillaceae bacterium]